MKINTERLEIVLLNPSQLDMWCSNITELENMLDFKYEGECLWHNKSTQCSRLKIHSNY